MDDSKRRLRASTDAEAGWVIATARRRRRDFAKLRSRLDSNSSASTCRSDSIDGPHVRATSRRAKFLGRAWQFGVPRTTARRCSAAPTIATALAVARAATGRGISKQTFNIMREGRRARSAHRRDRISSRSSRSILNARSSMLNAGEDLPSKKTAAGQAERRRLLAEHFDLPAAPPAAQRSTTCSMPTRCCGARAVSTSVSTPCSATGSATSAASRCASSVERSRARQWPAPARSRRA